MAAIVGFLNLKPQGLTFIGQEPYMVSPGASSQMESWCTSVSCMRPYIHIYIYVISPPKIKQDLHPFVSIGFSLKHPPFFSQVGQNLERELSLT